MKIKTMIIGGGIAGLYSACKLTNRSLEKPQDIAVFEKTTKLGGRLDTKYSAKNIPIELGAGRFNYQKHPLLKKLLKDLKIETCDFFHGCSLSHSENIELTNEIFSLKTIENINFVDWVKKKFGSDYLQNLIENSGYDVLGNEELPLLEAIKILNRHPETSNSTLNNEWRQLPQGFNHLISKLHDHLQKRNIPFYYSHELIQILKDAQGYELYFNHHGFIKKYRADTVILALPQDALRHVHTNFNIESLLNSISTVPLFKAFCVFPETLWFLINISSDCYFTSSTPLRRFYCLPDKNQIICYCDSKGATYWAHLLKTQGTIGLTKEIKRLIADFFKIDLQLIPNIEEIYYRYWPNGVSFSNEEKNLEKYQNDYIHNNLFFVSDMFSAQPGWIEGALSHVEKMIQHFSIRMDKTMVS